MRVIYIDVLFLNNAVINAFLLTVCAFLCGLKIKLLRIAGAACTGALYCVCAYLPDMGFIVFLPLKITVSFIMAGIAYGRWEWLRLIKYTAMFYLCSFVLAGVLLCGCVMSGAAYFYINGAVYYSIPALMLVLSLLTAVLIGYSSVMSAVKRRSMSDFYKNVCISVCGKSICISGFVDSGNTLAEPMTGLAVSVISRKSAEKLFGRKGLKRLYSFALTEVKIYPVFCRGAVGSGIMPAFIPDTFTADGKSIRGMIAISEEFCDDMCDMLLNRSALDFLKEEESYDIKAYCKALSKDDK